MSNDWICWVAAYWLMICQRSWRHCGSKGKSSSVIAVQMWVCKSGGHSGAALSPMQQFRSFTELRRAPADGGQLGHNRRLKVQKKPGGPQHVCNTDVPALISAERPSAQFSRQSSKSTGTQRCWFAAWLGHRDESQCMQPTQAQRFPRFSSAFMLYLDSCFTLQRGHSPSCFPARSESSSLIVSPPGNLSPDTRLISYLCLFMTFLDK